MALIIDRTGQKNALPKCRKAVSTQDRTNTLGNAQKDPASLCTIGYGPYGNAFDVAGQTIEYVRQRLTHLFNIPANALAVINGEPVVDESDVVLLADCRLEFVLDVGVKGLGAMLTPAQLKRRWKINNAQYQKLLDMGLPKVELHDKLLHPEEEVDEWFRCRARRSNQTASRFQPRLTPLESKIIEVLKAAMKPLKATAIANRADLKKKNASSLRTTLALLRRFGILTLEIDGY